MDNLTLLLILLVAIWLSGGLFTVGFSLFDLLLAVVLISILVKVSKKP